MHTLPVASLRRLLGGDLAGASCQCCGLELSTSHEHIVNVRTRSLLCACVKCHVDVQATGSGTDFRAVPHRYRRLSTEALTDAEWELADVPVGIAFFFFNSGLERMVALYPSAAGVTESLLPSATLEVVFERVRASQRLVADVEAVVVRRSPGGGDLFLVPIDACYELAGRIRQQWRGFGGGSEAQRAIESFFTMLHDRAELAPV